MQCLSFWKARCRERMRIGTGRRLFRSTGEITKRRCKQILRDGADYGRDVVHHVYFKGQSAEKKHTSHAAEVFATWEKA